MKALGSSKAWKVMGPRFWKKTTQKSSLMYFPIWCFPPTGCLQIVENSAERLKDWWVWKALGERGTKMNPQPAKEGEPWQPVLDLDPKGGHPSSESEQGIIVWPCSHGCQASDHLNRLTGLRWFEISSTPAVCLKQKSVWKKYHAEQGSTNIFSEVIF